MTAETSMNVVGRPLSGELYRALVQYAATLSEDAGWYGFVDEACDHDHWDARPGSCR